MPGIGDRGPPGRRAVPGGRGRRGREDPGRADHQACRPITRTSRNTPTCRRSWSSRSSISSPTIRTSSPRNGCGSASGAMPRPPRQVVLNSIAQRRQGQGLARLLLLPPLPLLLEEAAGDEQFAEGDAERPADRLKQVGLVAERRRAARVAHLGPAVEDILDIEPDRGAAEEGVLRHQVEILARNWRTA